MIIPLKGETENIYIDRAAYFCYAINVVNVRTTATTARIGVMRPERALRLASLSKIRRCREYVRNYRNRW